MEVNKESAPVKAGRSGKQVKFFAGGAIVVLVIAYLIFSSMKGATAEYVTTSEAKAVGLANRMVRVSGVIVGDTINWDAQGLLLKFELSDDAGRLPGVGLPYSRVVQILAALAFPEEVETLWSRLLREAAVPADLAVPVLALQPAQVGARRFGG